MKSKLLIAILTLTFSIPALAQQPEYIGDGALVDGHNIVNINITSPVYSTWAFSVERIINKRISVKAALGIMPEGKIPLLGTISSTLSDYSDDFDFNTLESATISTFSFSPEVRFYLGKGYGKGFYLSPYYRYGKFNLNGFTYDYTTEDNEKYKTEMKANFNSNNIGLMIGNQWLLGKKKNIVIDWNIVGLHAGFAKGTLDGKVNGSFTLDDADRISVENGLNDFLEEIPYITGTIKVNNDNSINMDTKSPWAFLRSSISVGFRF